MLDQTSIKFPQSTTTPSQQYPTHLAWLRHHQDTTETPPRHHLDTTETPPRHRRSTTATGTPGRAPPSCRRELQSCFVLDVVKFKNLGSLAELLRFGRCQVQKLSKCRKIAAFSSLPIDRQIDRCRGNHGGMTF